MPSTAHLAGICHSPPGPLSEVCYLDCDTEHGSLPNQLKQITSQVTNSHNINNPYLIPNLTASRGKLKLPRGAQTPLAEISEVHYHPSHMGPAP